MSPQFVSRNIETHASGPLPLFGVVDDSRTQDVIGGECDSAILHQAGTYIVSVYAPLIIPAPKVPLVRASILIDGSPRLEILAVTAATKPKGGPYACALVLPPVGLDVTNGAYLSVALSNCDRASITGPESAHISIQYLG